MSDARKAVLLVDDEEHILSALLRTLRREGYELIAVRTPNDALAVLAAREVAVVVSDQKMPGASGVDFLRRVAELHPGVRRVLLTGWPEEIPESARRAARLDALLPKPWDEAELKGVLRRCTGS
jgi:response regulator RpfG family c-di-GMP phosphodiesterase